MGKTSIFAIFHKSFNDKDLRPQDELEARPTDLSLWGVLSRFWTKIAETSSCGIGADGFCQMRNKRRLPRRNVNDPPRGLGGPLWDEARLRLRG